MWELGPVEAAVVDVEMTVLMLTTRLHHRAFDEADEAVALETDAGAVVTTFDTDWADPG